MKGEHKRGLRVGGQGGSPAAGRLGQSLLAFKASSPANLTTISANNPPGSVVHIIVSPSLAHTPRTLIYFLARVRNN